MMKNRTFLVSQMVLNLLLVLSLVFLSSIGCQVSQSDAEDVLGDEGFHDVVVEDWAPFSCSDTPSRAIFERSATLSMLMAR